MTPVEVLISKFNEKSDELAGILEELYEAGAAEGGPGATIIFSNGQMMGSNQYPRASGQTLDEAKKVHFKPLQNKVIPVARLKD